MSDLPDTRTHLNQIVQALRMAAFPRVLWDFADAYSTAFVPTKEGAKKTQAAVRQIRNDAAFRHWISENAELEHPTYCRMALHMLFEVLEHAPLEQKQQMTARIANAPLLCKIVDFGFDVLIQSLKA